MIEVVIGGRPEDVRQTARHRLFVEGGGSDAVDPQVLSELLDGPITVEAMGPSFSVRSVAEALHPFHPTYYFLIDRDHHHDDAYVDRCWDQFPDPDTHNLLVWRCQELENYFLEPGYLARSAFIQIDRPTLETRIKAFCRERLYLDAANHVIVSIRETLKHQWINQFSNPAGFASREQALAALLERPEFDAFRTRVDTQFAPEQIEAALDTTLHRMTGDSDTLEFGTGDWLHRVKGKKILSRLVNSGAFKVEDTQGKILQGRQKLGAVIKNLLRQELSVQPRDFQRLKQLVEGRLTVP